MNLEIITSHAVLPVTDPIEVTALVELKSRGAAADAPVDVRFVLDRSGSMDEPSGIGSVSKLTALMNAVCASIDLLAATDQVACLVFAGDTREVIAPSRIASDVDRSRMKRSLRAIRSGGNTAMADAFERALAVASLGANVARRVVLFTDGQVNASADEVPRCLALAERAAEQRIPLAVFAVGVSYDEAFLRAIATRAGLGSYFAHLGDTDQLRAMLGDEIAVLRTSAERDLTVTIAASAGVSLLDVVRFVPQQSDVAYAARGAEDKLAALDARGQKYLVRCRLAATSEGVRSLFEAKVSYSVGGRTEQATREAFVELSNDAARWLSPNGAVLATVVNAAGVRAATQGNVLLARTLFERAGNAAMVRQLTVLGSAAAADPAGAAGRALRTVAATQAHLPTLGGTPPARTP